MPFLGIKISSAFIHTRTIYGHPYSLRIAAYAFGQERLRRVFFFFENSENVKEMSSTNFEPANDETYYENGNFVVQHGAEAIAAGNSAE